MFAPNRAQLSPNRQQLIRPNQQLINRAKTVPLALLKAKAIPTAEDKAFWNNRFTEHWFFLYELIDGEKFPELKKFAKEKFAEWNRTPTNHTQDQLEELMDFKQMLFKRQDARDPIGMIFPSLLKHMIMELQHYLDLSAGKLTNEDQLNFHLKEGSEHSDLAGHLIDPMHPGLVLKNLNTGNTLASLIGVPPSDRTLSIVDQANTDAKTLLQGISAGQVKALLTPMMLEHEIHESTWGQMKLEQLLAQAGM